MATAFTETSSVTDAWQQAFNREDRQQLLEEDSEAFRGVTGILMFLISAGLLLGVVSLLIVLLLG